MRRCYRRTVAVCAILACVVPGAAQTHAASPTTSSNLHARANHRLHLTHRAASTIAQLTAEMLTLLNADRAGAGRAPLTLDPRLAAVATDHSRDMATRHYFAHTAPGGDDAFERFARKGINFDNAGENIGQAGGGSLPLEISAINATMMAEPLDGVSHHAIIVDPSLHRVGVGICVEPGNTIYLTEDFTN